MKTLAGLVSIVFGAVALSASVAAAQPGEEEPVPDSEADGDPASAPVPVEPDGPPPTPVEPSGPAPVPVGPGGATFDAAPADYRAHLGFFARIILAPVGYARQSSDVMGVTAAVKGLAGGFFLSAGYSVMPRLALHLDVGGIAMANPTFEFDGNEVDTTDTSAATVGIGPGATYYLTSNAYVSGSLLFGAATIDDGSGGDPASTDTGAALSIVGGKEWWVGSNIGVGVVGHLMFGSYPDEGDTTVQHVSFAIAFSGTYN